MQHIAALRGADPRSRFHQQFRAPTVSPRHPDCVLLDINLDGQDAFGLAQELQSAGIHTVFTTGYDFSFVPAGLRGIACLQKPLQTDALIRAVRTK